MKRAKRIIGLLIFYGLFYWLAIGLDFKITDIGFIVTTGLFMLYLYFFITADKKDL